MLDRSARWLPAVLFSFLAVVFAGCAGGNLLELAGRWETLGCCGLIILILDIIAIIELAGSTKDTGSKILWIALIVFFPIGGLIIYYLIGK